MSDSSSDINLNEKSDPESRFIPSAVFIYNESTDYAKEQAFILGELYHKAAEKHLQLESKVLVVGIFLILAGGIVASWGIINGLLDNYITGGVILIILAVLILVYGFYIDKPKKLVSLSKVYTTSHLFPFESALIIDGTDVVPDQTLQYNDIALDEVIAVSQKLPEPPITFDKEQQLLITMEEKQKLLEDVRPFSLLTPALLKNDVYTKAILECMQVSQVGEPKYGVLNVKVDYQTALGHAEKIRFLSGLGGSVSIINTDCENAKEKAEPFLQNFKGCISIVDNHFSEVCLLLKNHFFSEINMHGDPKSDKLYGYGIIQHKYHIPVGSYPKDDSTPINPVQNAIDTLDDASKDILSMTVKNAERAIIQRQRTCEDLVEQITRTVESQVSQFAHQHHLKSEEYMQLSENWKSLFRKREQYWENRKEYERKVRREESEEYPNQSLINQYQAQANDYDRRADDISNQIDMIDDQKNRITGEMRQIIEQQNLVIDQGNSDVENTKRKAEHDINLLQNELEEDIRRSRAHIEPIIEARDKVISMMEIVTRDIMPNEQDRHDYPFKTKLDCIQKQLDLNLSEMQGRLNERSKVLEQIDSIRIDTSIDKPVSIMIPFWIACLEGKRGLEYAIIPLQKTQKPEEALTGRKTASILTPLFQSLESSKKYLQKDGIYKEAASYSIYPGKLDKNISNAIDDLQHSGYFSEGISKRMKKEYALEGGA